VYVVDDDPSVRRALERLFRLAGWPVRTFASAEDFLRHDRSGNGGCVVLDVHLGGMRGFELQAVLRERNDPMPVILISGVDSAAVEAARRGLGPADFFQKRVDVGALMEVVESHLVQPASSG
jgi:FixJ family two-component response regulator